MGTTGQRALENWPQPRNPWVCGLSNSDGLPSLQPIPSRLLNQQVGAPRGRATCGAGGQGLGPPLALLLPPSPRTCPCPLRPSAPSVTDAGGSSTVQMGTGRLWQVPAFHLGQTVPGQRCVGLDPAFSPVSGQVPELTPESESLLSGVTFHLGWGIRHPQHTHSSLVQPGECGFLGCPRQQARSRGQACTWPWGT